MYHRLDLFLWGHHLQEEAWGSDALWTGWQSKADAMVSIPLDVALSFQFYDQIYKI